MTTQSKMISAVLLLAAVLFIVGLYGVEWLGFYTLPTRGGIDATIRVGVAPPLVGWAGGAAQDFMGRNRQIRVEVVELKATDATDRLGAGSGDVIDAWIADAQWVRDDLGNIPYSAAGPSVASDSLIWVGVPQNGPAGGLNWESVHEAAVSDRNFDLALPPANSVEGAAACLSAAAAYHGRPELSNRDISDGGFRSWMADLLQAEPAPGLSPVAQLTNRPPRADTGLVRASEWAQLDRDRFESQEPAFNVHFDFPYLTRTQWPVLSAGEAEAQRVAAQRFGEFLMERGPQRDLQSHGLSAGGEAVPGETVRVENVSLNLLYDCWR